MKVLVAGSRSITDSTFVFDVLDEVPWDVDVVVHGNADGVDSLAREWARINDVGVETHPVPEWVWERFGRKAGPQRNSYMIDQADAVVVIWDGVSSGTKDTMSKADADGMPMRKVVVDVADDGSVTNVVLDKVKDSEQTCLHDYE